MVVLTACFYRIQFIGPNKQNIDCETIGKTLKSMQWIEPQNNCWRRANRRWDFEAPAHCAFERVSDWNNGSDQQLYPKVMGQPSPSWRYRPRGLEARSECVLVGCIVVLQST